ncbi:TerB family tellurite resistance protein [Chitinophaga alhagiae]|uniref:TerB family tellurite resistance protein n=1 Tax=Chitinophaga alhagiae TaxID=2203219 RepID=UPI000E5B2966|nr:TerB family tellurite resistance protein [Chitinophaga alhagiae]
MRITFILIFPLLLSFSSTRAQSDELIQLGLNIEKLNQFRQILSDMRKAYTVLSRGYSTVRDLSQGNFKVHELFLDGLMAVSPGVARYRRIPEIISTQRVIVTEYRRAMARFRGKGLFSPDELAAMQRVYAGLFDRTVSSLEELALIVTGGKLRMSDGERMAAIDRLFEALERELDFLRQFNTNNTTVADIRERKFKEIHQLTAQQGE